LTQEGQGNFSYNPQIFSLIVFQDVVTSVTGKHKYLFIRQRGDFVEDRQIRIALQVYLSSVGLILFLFTGGWELFVIGLIIANGLAYASSPISNFLSNLPENPELLNSGMNGARSEA
jgi:hypothetical protein